MPPTIYRGAENLPDVNPFGYDLPVPAPWERLMALATAAATLCGLVIALANAGLGR